MDYDFIIPKETNLIDFLKFNAKLYPDSCNPRMSMFYFRINHLGLVDSLYSEGNFDTKEKEAINQNILKTNRNWILPNNTKDKDKCWFIYPCFIIGGLDNCDIRAQKKREELLVLRSLLFKKAAREDSLGRYLLPPNLPLVNIRR